MQTFIDDLSADFVRDCLNYDPHTGKLTWRQRPISHFKGTAKRTSEHLHLWWNRRFAEKPAGNLNYQGYAHIKINGRMRLAHRLAWLIATGSWPTGELDHINGARSDNRLCNPREVTRSGNMQNIGGPRNNTSGERGVGRSKQNGRWIAHIGINGRHCNLGYFDTFEDAKAARIKAEAEHHPFSTRPEVLEYRSAALGEGVAA